MQIKNYFLIIGSALLVGCASESDLNLDKDLHDVTTKLTESAQSINRSLYELARIERASHPAARLPNPVNPLVAGMPQKVTIDWTGPVGPLVEKIARISHYKVRILGNPPAVPIIVSVTAKAVPLIDILRNANFQCGERANIALYTADKVIELRYAKN